MLESRSIDLLMALPPSDQPVIIPICRGESRQKAGLQQFIDPALHIGHLDVIHGVQLGLECLGFGRVYSLVIAEIPETNERESSDRRALGDLL